jgi:chromosome segregation ATPase
MQEVQDYATTKAQLEEKIANLKREKEAVQKEVESLSQKVTIEELEKQARTLEGELGGLKGKKSVLEQKLSGFDAPPVQSAPTQQRPMVRTVSQ